MIQILSERIKEQHLSENKRKHPRSSPSSLPPPDVDFIDLFKDKPLLGCSCATNTYSCQICFFTLLSTIPSYSYCTKRLLALLDFKKKGGNVLELESGFEYALSKINKF